VLERSLRRLDAGLKRVERAPKPPARAFAMVDSGAAQVRIEQLDGIGLESSLAAH
jgi:hypothetical protein